MKTYEIIINGTSRFFKSEAGKNEIKEAIEFVKKGDVTLDKVLQALRMLGFKSTPITIEPMTYLRYRRSPWINISK